MYEELHEDYFENDQYISNSDLGMLQDLISCKEERDLSPYYNFGTLIDALITEPHKVDHDAKSVKGIKFSDEAWETALAMREAGKEDRMLRLMCMAASFQKEVYNPSFTIEYDGYVFTVPVRMKADFYVQVLVSAGDLKSTACTTYKSFLAAIDLFDYDRQAAWYMDIAELYQFVIVGISKVKNRKGKHDIFKKVITRGDDMYLRGREKYSRLAWLYKFLILNLFPNVYAIKKV
jgi:hypothetical protein